MMLRFYPGMTVEDVGRMTIGQMEQRIDDMEKIAKMEGGGNSKPLEDMTATEKIEHYKSIGEIA